MKKCEACGQQKPEDAIRCPSCNELDHHVAQAMVSGTPSLTILVLVMIVFWGYRFWALGWDAFAGNLRFAALTGAGLGIAGILFGPMWTFGIRSRKKAAILLLVSVVAFLIFNLL